MNRLWLACFGALMTVALHAHAETAQVVPGGCGVAGYPAVLGGQQMTQDASGRTCVSSVGPGIAGFAKLSLTNASTLLSTATVGPGSATWPTVPAVVDVTNDPASADTIYACPTGSTPTCTTATGIPIYVGQTFRFTRPSTTMTLIAASTATIEVQF
jgi:hypothetical protein